MRGRAILRDDHIVMEHEHVSDAKEVFARIEAVAGLAHSSGVHRLFVDTAFMHGVWTDEEVPDIIDLTSELFPPGVVIATIPPAPSSLDKVREIVRQLNCAGFPTRMFPSREEALDWLLSDGPFEVSTETPAPVRRAAGQS